MKKNILFLSIVLGPMALAGIASADLVNVTMSWTMADVTGVQGYRINYSYNADMSGKITHSECGAPSLANGRYTMVCTNVDIAPDQLPVYFEVEAYDSENEAPSASKEVVILPVKNFLKSTK